MEEEIEIMVFLISAIGMCWLCLKIDKAFRILAEMRAEEMKKKQEEEEGQYPEHTMD